MAILLNGWILPTGGVASGRVCPAAWAAGLFRTKCSLAPKTKTFFFVSIMLKLKAAAFQHTLTL